VLEMVSRLLVALAIDRNRPRFGLELPGERRRLVFVGAELVIIVVCGDLLPGVRLLVGAERGFLISGFEVLELASMRRGRSGAQKRLGTDRAGDSRRSCAGSGADERATVPIQGLSGDFRATDVGRGSYQH